MHTFLNCIRYRRFIIHYSKNYYSQNKNPNLISLLQTMPKDPKHIPEAQKIRKKIKEKSSKYVPGRVTLQVLGTGAEGAPRSLYIFSDQSRYLFNCGEGTQRLAHEHKMKISKLEHIFVTQPVWKNIGGLPGLALTIQDVGVPQITLHGPQGLDQLFVATKRFVVIKNLHIKMAECNTINKFEDNVMTVEYVPLDRHSSGASSSFKMNNSFNERESFASSTIDESFTDESIDSNSLDKNTQAGTSTDTLDAGTCTRFDKRKRSRRNSQSIGPFIEEDVVEDNTDYYAYERKKRKNKRRSRSQSVSGTRTVPERISESSKLRLSETKERGVSMAYICRLQPRPGALCLEKCVKYGVPAGPLLGKLKGGEDVTLQSGVVVRSVDVRDPDDPGPVFIVIDCPSIDYLPSVIENGKFKRHQKFAENDNDFAYLVVHFSPKSVTDHPSYKLWISDFSPSTQHLILNDANSCMGSIAVHRIQYKLNILHPEIFPLLGDKGTEIVEDQVIESTSHKRMKIEMVDSEIQAVDSDPSLDGLSVDSRPTSPIADYIYSNTFINFHLRPRKGIDRSAELKLIPSQYIEETMQVEGFKDELQNLKIALLNKKIGVNIRSHPKVLFLGTGSCIPNKTRNTSGILLETSDSCMILMDCGEGTYGQLVRFYGIERINDILVNIKAVYVSHLHADHHIGLIGFLEGRRKALNTLQIDREPVYLFAPRQILNWLVFYDRCFENISHEYVIIPNDELILGEEAIDKEEKSKILNTLNLTDINTTLVRHCPNAFGVSITHKDNYKITYSGDTMPCPNLIKLGMHSDLLIHEATMEDELAGEAVIKMHSTTSQAISVGRSMKAKYTLLTHFSQRYAKLPRFNDNFADNVGIAFDNMQIKLDELPLVPLLYPSLKIMFAEHYEELEQKAVKRQLRIERQRSISKERTQPTNKHLLKA